MARWADYGVKEHWFVVFRRHSKVDCSNTSNWKVQKDVRAELVKNENMEIEATHETPKSHYVDDLRFVLTGAASDSCMVEGNSNSETWYAVLDKGTNYCNLRNLITGADLDKSVGFTEKTSDSICTQYSSANCDVY
ncbi:hypothetical protein CAPTEDRAFT_203420 [Capitella teleta]|uniref:Uncharacterized protein n=1 Tax=Capitella teleta TaxID=283909 RepID=R7VA25_CAPTE|nr:hypothetical protein CAPTEDRAFT_203420 [Capitella teleta]|eukprot:ELU15469.1 hypothetical protein CAPTEDRAFT_203420 [Capitella teleta]